MSDGELVQPIKLISDIYPVCRKFSMIFATEAEKQCSELQQITTGVRFN